MHLHMCAADTASDRHITQKQRGLMDMPSVLGDANTAHAHGTHTASNGLSHTPISKGQGHGDDIARQQLGRMEHDGLMAVVTLVRIITWLQCTAQVAVTITQRAHTAKQAVETQHLAADAWPNATVADAHVRSLGQIMPATIIATVTRWYFTQLQIVQ